MTIRDLIAEASARLKRADIEHARLEAEALLAHLLKRDLSWLLAHPEARVTPLRARAYAKLVTRRTKRWPFAYVIGERGFYGRVFAVTPDVLVPRPSTEGLVEALLERVPSGRRGMFLDIGTGSGALGLTLLAERPKMRGVLYDISTKALTVARENARRLKLGRRARIARLDILKRRLPEPRESFVVIAANLPYLPTARLKGVWPEVKREPRLALVSGADGLRHYRALFRTLRRWKRPPDLLAIEAEPDQFTELRRLAAEAMPDARLSLLKDLHGDARVMIAENENAP